MSMVDDLLINSGNISVEIIHDSIVDRNKFFSSHFRFSEFHSLLLLLVVIVHQPVSVFFSFLTLLVSSLKYPSV